MGRRQRRRWALRLAAATVLCSISLVASPPARANVLQAHNDTYSTGWYPDESALSPAVVTGGTFGKLFSSTVSGQVYAQPLVAENTLLVSTENDKAYGLDPRDGTQRWSTDLGTPWDPANIGCADLTPSIGVTGTPVVDATTGTEYVVAKTALAAKPSEAAYAMHAIDVVTGAERAGFPVPIAGRASNAPNVSFNATHELQRPGLLLLNGVVYAAFGGHCDIEPYTGWVVGVSTAARITTMWVSQQSGANGSGIWQSGGPLVADGPNRILLATGNGHLVPTGPTPGDRPPPDLSEAVVSLRVDPDGSLKADDFFTPYDAPELDVNDADFGSGGVVALPESYDDEPLFGTASHPHLMLEEGKEGYVYLLDRDDLGGFADGPAGSDDALARIGPYGGVWSTPAVWPGDGGYVYIVHATGVTSRSGYLRAYHYGLDATGNPEFSMVGQSVDPFGFGSGAPVVTSDGLDPSSALVWMVWQPNATGVGAQLRAYSAAPVDGSLQMVWSAPIGTGVKFSPPAVSGGRVYVGTRDGTVLGFGSPVDEPLAPSPSSLFFQNTIVGQTTTQSVTFTATRPLTVDALDVSGPTFSAGSPSLTLPATMQTGDSLTVPVSFTPTARQLMSGTVVAVVDDGTDVPVSLSGLGQLATGDLAVFPGQLSLGGVAVGGSPIAGTFTYTNVGAGPLHVTGLTLPAAGSNLSVSGMPAIGTLLAPGASVVVTVTFTPRTRGVFAATVVLKTDAPPPGTAIVGVPVSATAAPGAHLSVSRNTTYLGALRVGAAASTTVRLTNNGGTSMTITKSKPPAHQVGFRATTELDEGTILDPGQSVTLRVTFTATKVGHFTDTWLVNADDGTGLHTLVFDAYVTNVRAAYWLLERNGTVHPATGTRAMGSAALPGGARAVALAPTPSGGGYDVLDNRGDVFAFGDAHPKGNVSVSSLRAGEQVSTMSMTPSGAGYWIFTSAGRVFTFGDAPRFGDLGALRLKGSIVASVATPTGLGYYLLGSDGGVFAFGDARFYGSTGGLRLNRPVVGLVPTRTGRGYWLVASDGGVFAFGDARFRGSMGGTHLNRPIAAMVRYGDGYLMVGSDGGIFDFSTLPFLGSLATSRLTTPIVAVGAFTT
jgi:iron transport multicopper oxidase